MFYLPSFLWQTSISFSLIKIQEICNLFKFRESKVIGTTKLSAYSYCENWSPQLSKNTEMSLYGSDLWWRNETRSTLLWIRLKKLYSYLISGCTTRLARRNIEWENRQIPFFDLSEINEVGLKTIDAINCRLPLIRGIFTYIRNRLITDITNSVWRIYQLASTVIRNYIMFFMLYSTYSLRLIARS